MNRYTPAILFLFLSVSFAAGADDGGWWLAVGCEGHGTFGVSDVTACKSSDCNVSVFASNGSCSRTSTGFTKLVMSTSSNGTLRSSTVYALHTGDVFITPALLSSEEKPVFMVRNYCPLANAALNWVFVQWDTARRPMTQTYLIGSANYDVAKGITLNGQFDIDGSDYFSGTRPMAGSCVNGVYATSDSANADLTGTVYMTGSGGGVFKTSPGHATFFFPQQTMLAVDLSSLTGRGIAFDSRQATNTRTARVTTNGAGTQFTIEPYLDPEAGTLDTSFTDVITVTAMNSPRSGMLIGTLSRNGGTATRVACIAYRNFDTRVICSGESPTDASYPYTVAIVFEGACPPNYLRVPQNPDVGVSADFCIAKYEMKISGDNNGNQPYNAAFVADPRAAGTPWVNVTRAQADAECQALGTGFHLPTNAQWQAVARNIEDSYSSGSFLNWKYGRQDNTAGQGFINMGHSDGAPLSALAASADNDPCNGTGNGSCADDTNADFAQKRTHQLSNGGILWDFAGNVWEWIQDGNGASQGADGYLYAELWNAGGKTRWGPRGDYTATGTYPKDSSPFGGFGYGWLNGSAGTLVRGGHWSDGTQAGVFTVATTSAPGDSDPSLGFRCAIDAQ